MNTIITKKKRLKLMLFYSHKCTHIGWVDASFSDGNGIKGSPWNHTCPSQTCIYHILFSIFTCRMAWEDWGSDISCCNPGSYSYTIEIHNDGSDCSMREVYEINRKNYLLTKLSNLEFSDP